MANPVCGKQQYVLGLWTEGADKRYKGVQSGQLPFSACPSALFRNHSEARMQYLPVFMYGVGWGHFFVGVGEIPLALTARVRPHSMLGVATGSETTVAVVAVGTMPILSLSLSLCSCAVFLGIGFPPLHF